MPISGGSSGGSVTSVATGTGLTGGPVTSTGTISLATIADGDVLANTSGSTSAPVATTISAALDHVFGNTRGEMLYRGASGWAILAPGTSGNVLTSNGPGADPSYQAAAGGAPAWTAKTANYTAVAGDNIFADTSAGAWTLKLPASASANDTIRVTDSAGTWNTYNLTLDPNGGKIYGNTNTIALSKRGEDLTFAYKDSTTGWVISGKGAFNFLQFNPVGSAWNPSDKASTVTLSNNNYDATVTGGWAAVRGATSHNSGKPYFEGIVDAVIANNLVLGVADATTAAASLAYPGANPYSGGLGSQGDTYVSAFGTGYVGNTATFSVGDVIGVGIDFSASRMYVYQNGVQLGYFGGITTLSYFPCAGMYQAGNKVTLVTDNARLTYLPAGFTAWG